MSAQGTSTERSTRDDEWQPTSPSFGEYRASAFSLYDNAFAYASGGRSTLDSAETGRFVVCWRRASFCCGLNDWPQQAILFFRRFYVAVDSSSLCRVAQTHMRTPTEVATKPATSHVNGTPSCFASIQPFATRSFR